ncbi:hypothetical protein C8F04DRAFT_127664 [Mycena alexandri]|uniref:Uncharacterized protein n=1 Tax=Mycena alexandri TaxID=1745969 RepID=A0AAD6WWA1_9AGAR|nr:hypothetical protein C8F04DRAFT_127664 [Mycena alexandri]
MRRCSVPIKRWYGHGHRHDGCHRPPCPRTLERNRHVPILVPAARAVVHIPPRPIILILLALALLPPLLLIGQVPKSLPCPRPLPIATPTPAVPTRTHQTPALPVPPHPLIHINHPLRPRRLQHRARRRNHPRRLRLLAAPPPQPQHLVQLVVLRARGRAARTGRNTPATRAPEPQTNTQREPHPAGASCLRATPTARNGTGINHARRPLLRRQPRTQPHRRRPQRLGTVPRRRPSAKHAPIPIRAYSRRDGGTVHRGRRGRGRRRAVRGVGVVRRRIAPRPAEESRALGGRRGRGRGRMRRRRRQPRRRIGSPARLLGGRGCGGALRVDRARLVLLLALLLIPAVARARPRARPQIIRRPRMRPVRLRFHLYRGSRMALASSAAETTILGVVPVIHSWRRWTPWRSQATNPQGEKAPRPSPSPQG